MTMLSARLALSCGASIAGVLSLWLHAQGCGGKAVTVGTGDQADAAGEPGAEPAPDAMAPFDSPGEDQQADADAHESARFGPWCECAPGTLEPLHPCGRPPKPPNPPDNPQDCSYWDESEPGDCGAPDSASVFTCCHGLLCRGRCLHFIDEQEAACVCWVGDAGTCEEEQECCLSATPRGCREAGTCYKENLGPY